MAVIEDLSTTQLEAIVAITDIKPRLNRLYSLLGALQTPTDAMLLEKRAALSAVTSIEVLIDAVWNSGVIAADAILNPEE